VFTQKRKEFYLDIRKVAGTDTVSRDHGKKIRMMIEFHLKLKNRITIDFSNFSIASPSFIDEACAKLLLTYSLEDLKENLIFINMTEFDRALLNDLVKARIRERNLLERTPKGKV
jgi:hypothetical protein